jgi:hypothetical protein
LLFESITPGCAITVLPSDIFAEDDIRAATMPQCGRWLTTARLVAKGGWSSERR